MAGSVAALLILDASHLPDPCACRAGRTSFDSSSATALEAALSSIMLTCCMLVGVPDTSNTAKPTLPESKQLHLHHRSSC
jgi:hypothetical protein